MTNDSSERATWERHHNISGWAGVLLSIHDSFRATSSAMRRLVNEGGDEDTIRARVRARFIPLAETLHHHHQREEQMLFPLIRARRGEAPTVLVDDHRVLTARLSETERLLRGEGEGSIADTIRALHDALRDHLEREETIAVPILLELTPVEAATLFR